MTFHILNGDSLAETLRNSDLHEEIIVCRECLIDGPVSSEFNEAFWKQRADYIFSSYNEPHENYNSKVPDELKKIEQIPQGSDIYLWFEDDLFCQVNMWFVVSLIISNNSNVNIYRIFPSQKDANNKWEGFGSLQTVQLDTLIKNRVKFSKDDIELATKLWKNYADNNLQNLSFLSKINSEVFRFLEEVIKAHIERFATEGRPEKTLKKIISEGKNNFNEIFSEFNKTEAIYGFGDSQVRHLLKNKLNYRE